MEIAVAGRTLLRWVSAITIFAVYWLLFAWANNMVVYYQQSIFPLLSATSTPNPYFFLYTDSPLAFYNSGIQWAPTGHILLQFLIGNSFFSVLLGVLLVFNLNYAYSVVGDSRHWDATGRIIVLVMLLVVLMASFSPIAALALLPFSGMSVTLPLEIWVSSYGEFGNIASSVLLLLLVPVWKQLLRHNHSHMQRMGSVE